LEKFEQFRRKFDPSFANRQTGSQGPKINWPSAQNAQVFQNNNAMEEDDDDLYS
jgi:hypothetical protein